MADNVGYSSGTGISIAADEVGGAYYQRVKVVVGADGTVSGDVGPTNGMPVTGAVGVSGTVSVLGTVSVSGAVPVSGTITILPTTLTVNTAATVAGASVTIQQGVSVSAVVSGTVSVVDANITTAVPSVSATGGIMWIVGGQSTTAFPVVITGTVTAGAGTTVVSGTITVNTAATVAGASVTIQQGASVSAVVSGTVSVLSIVPVTTQASVSVSGFPVWMNPTQAVVVNTIAAGFSVNALVTGAVSISVLPAVSISVSAVLGTIVTQLGTQMVSIAQTSVSVAVIPTVSTIVTILGTQMVSMAQTSVSVAVVPTISTVVTVLGTVLMSQVGYLYTTTGVTTGTAQAVWIMNPTTVTATITVSQPFGDAIAFSFTTVSAPTVVTPALMTVAWLGTTVLTSMYVVPVGRRLEIQAVICQVQNTAASIGFGRIEVYVRASLSSSVTVGPVVVYMAAVARSSGTNAANAEVANYGLHISTTYSVGFAYKASGGTGHLVSFVVQGVLY